MLTSLYHERKRNLRKAVKNSKKKQVMKRNMVDSSPPVHRPLRWAYSACFLNKYIIKSYAMSVAYDEAKSIKFYDKKGTLIPEEHIPDL